MATAIQKNGMKTLTNGTLSHTENVSSLENAGLRPISKVETTESTNICSFIKVESTQESALLCPVKVEPTTDGTHLLATATTTATTRIEHSQSYNNTVADGANLCSSVKHEPFDANYDGFQQHNIEYNDGRLQDNQINNADEQEEIDISINNVVCSFSVRCHLNLREIALNGSNVEYRRENGMITMKLRRPYTTASIWSSGKITCTGATSEDEAKIAARRFARSLQKLGFKVRFNNYRVVNVLGTCSMPFGIKITSFSVRHKGIAEYEPELHPGVTYKLKDPKATIKIFSTGSITVTAPSVAAVKAAVEHIYPLVYEYRKELPPEDVRALRMKKRSIGMGKRNREETLHDSEDVIFNDFGLKIEEEDLEEEEIEENYESDASWD